MPSATAPPRVLVVDDDDDIREVLGLMVERLGNVAFFARDGVEAVEALQAEKFDLMLLDLTMPRMSGEDVLRWLREHPDVAPGLRVVVVSALAKESRATLEELDVDVVLEKPVRAAQFRLAVGGPAMAPRP